VTHLPAPASWRLQAWGPSPPLQRFRAIRVPYPILACGEQGQGWVWPSPAPKLVTSVNRRLRSPIPPSPGLHGQTP
jgi:hypothetical protein